MEFPKFQPRGKEGYMKLKLVLMVLALSMCSYSSEQNELKIVSLSTTHTEIIDSLDAEDQLVGIDAFYKLDLPVERIDAFTVTADEIAALNPDIVFVAFDFNGIIEGLENKDITYALLPPAKNLNEVYEQINIVGDLIGKSAKATEVVRDMKIEINSIFNNVNYENVSVYHEIGYSYGIYSVNGDSLIGEIYNQLGINNIAQNVEDPFESGFPALNEEFVLEANPDFVIVGHSDYLNKDLSTRAGWEAINAVQNDNVYFLDENLANNWGTTTVQLVSELSNSFSETNKTNEFSDVFVLVSLLVLSTIGIYIPRKRKEKV